MLILEDGSSVFDSRFILEYLEAKFPTPALLPDSVDDRLAARQTEVIADGVCDACVLLFWERQRPPAQQSREWIARQQRKIDGGVAALARLAGDRAFMIGDRFGLADIATASALGYLGVRLAELPWRARHPNLAAFSDRMEQRQSFHDTVPVAQTISDKVV